MTEGKPTAIEARPSSARVCTLCIVTRLPRDAARRQAFVSRFSCHEAADASPTTCSWCKRTRPHTLRCLVCRETWHPRENPD